MDTFRQVLDNLFVPFHFGACDLGIKKLPGRDFFLVEIKELDIFYI